MYFPFFAVCIQLCFSPSCNDGRSSQRDEDIGSNVEYNQIVELIARDDADKFVSLLKSQLEKENSDNGNSNFCPRELIMCICHYRAVKCAAGLIGGATGQTMDLNVPLKDGSYPLHHAAQSLSLHLIHLFINKGADINLRCNEVGSKFYRLLPLDVALEQIRNHVEWTPKQSIFRLIFDICDLKLKGFLGIVRRLCFGVDEDDVLYHYAKEGKLIHFVTMLMAAQGFCLHPNEDGYNLDGSISLRQLISSDIASIGPEYMLQGRRSRKHAQMLKEKKTVTSSVMLLLEIFQRINHIRSDILWSHLTFALPRVSSAEVAVCLKNEGYSLTDEDVNYLERNALAATPFYSSGLGKFRAETKERQLPSHLCRKPKANRGMLIEQQRSISTCSLHVKPGLSSLVQSFQTSQSFKVSVGFELCTTMEAQVKKTCQTTERHLPNIMAIKKWSFLRISYEEGFETSMR
ncbi:hypothetical protein F0562_022899 [Nyssa sinensis]|uniref:Uncharacterized protein n=1 Tax=Nyssa sinensis TaxID=561372 RepID=A0A5J5BIV7_9ASTE|nr:hypothetical protein F0562_022899 [Nyssa sinensis]